MTQAAPARKPRTAPPETRRRQLIDATITAISKHGLSGTTLTVVTREAGLSLGLVNFHFRNKEGLFAQTLNFLAQEHRDLWMRDLTRRDLTPAAKLNAIVDAQFHPRVCNRKKLSVWFAFFGEVAHRKAYRATSSEIDMERQMVCAELCRDIMCEAACPDVAPEDIAATLEGMFDGLWLNILMYPDRFTRADAHRQVLGYLAQVFPKHFG